jgi:hypothetical protein
MMDDVNPALEDMGQDYGFKALTPDHLRQYSTALDKENKHHYSLRNIFLLPR